MDASAANVNSLLDLVVAWDAGPARERADDDNCLIRGFLATGSNRDFERLVARHKDRVHRLAASVIGPGLSAEAEDATQDVFVQVYRKLSTFRMRSSFTTWLYRITYNLALEHRKKALKRLPDSGEDSLPGSTRSDPHDDPSRAADARERRRRVLRCVENLDEPYRTVVHLHYWMNMPVSEIAGVLNSREGTVKSHLHRARSRLAKALMREAKDE